VKNKKTKFLNKGEWKRLSIAEEMVHGPKLLLLDEPLNGVSMTESSILMNTFREMVNQDRTVVATMHQPSPEIFKLFDTLLLLSKGRVIYYGPTSQAATFFVNSPFAYDMSAYTNPADFFSDISAGFVTDGKGETVDCSLLEHHFKESDGYNRLMTKLKRAEVLNRSTIEAGGVENPINRGSDVEAG
jgi:ABC-type multidrug transport system ATPase subunit